MNMDLLSFSNFSPRLLLQGSRSHAWRLDHRSVAGADPVQATSQPTLSSRMRVHTSESTCTLYFPSNCTVIRKPCFYRSAMHKKDLAFKSESDSILKLNWANCVYRTQTLVAFYFGPLLCAKPLNLICCGAHRRQVLAVYSVTFVLLFLGLFFCLDWMTWFAE